MNQLIMIHHHLKNKKAYFYLPDQQTQRVCMFIEFSANCVDPQFIQLVELIGVIFAFSIGTVGILNKCFYGSNQIHFGTVFQRNGQKRSHHLEKGNFSDKNYCDGKERDGRCDDRVKHSNFPVYRGVYGTVVVHGNQSF